MGTGINTVVIALSSFFIEPKMTIVLASFISIFGGLGMLNIDKKVIVQSFWLPITLAMMVGGICGAMALKYVDARIFEFVLGSGFLIVSLWLIADTDKTDVLDKKAPHKAGLIDNVMGMFAGFCNGFIGLSAVPLITYFSRVLTKKGLRRFLVLLYLPVSSVQTGTFFINGMLTREIVIYGLVMLPFMVLGLYCGNKIHYRVSEIWFKRILGAFMAFVSIRLIF